MSRARDVANSTTALNVDGTIKLDGNYPVGTSNVALGDTALDSNVSGNYNTAIGADALTANTASNNTAVGYQAGYANTTGTELTFFGYKAGANTTGSYNTYVGSQTGITNTSGTGNTGVGWGAISSTSGATDNTAVGYGAGSSMTTGSKNTIIGRYNGNENGLDIRTSSNNIVLSDGDGNPRQYVDSSAHFAYNGVAPATTNGNIGHIYSYSGGANNICIAGTTTGSNRFTILEHRRPGRSGNARCSQISIGENASSQGEVQAYSSAANADISGGVVLSNGATSWSSISDARLKNVTGTYSNALADIATIEPIKFTWKGDTSNTPQVGVIAQSVEKVVPEAIGKTKNIAAPEDDTEYLSVRYTELIPLMIASIKEQQAIITALEARIAALEAN